MITYPSWEVTVNDIASCVIRDPWNVLDLCIIVVCGLSGGAVISKRAWTPYVAAVAAFFAWLKVFYFMRAFTATGGLVRMVMQIGYDMRHLLLLLVVVIMAATTSFYVLLPGAWQECALMSSDYLWYQVRSFECIHGFVHPTFMS